MTKIRFFQDAVRNATSVASDIKASQKKIIGYMCSYAPEELILAAGFHPFRLFSSKTDIILAENHLQSYCCSLVRGVLEDNLSGRLDFLDGTVFPHTCDSIQRLSDIWRINPRHTFFWDVTLPVKLNTESSKAYMIEVLNKFKSELEKASGRTISDDEIEESFEIYNLIRRSLSRINLLRSKNPGVIRSSDFYALVKGSMIMDRRTAAEKLQAIADDLEKQEIGEDKGKRIVLSGSICDSQDIYSILESAGAFVCGDDMCTGQRWFDGEIDSGPDPIAAMADRYMNRIICPAKHIDIDARIENIIHLADKKDADGVIFILLKFCDPHAFDYPDIKEALDGKGIKNILIELDDQQQNLGQLSTRIESFIQII